jgi:hypothetical protein
MEAAGPLKRWYPTTTLNGITTQKMEAAWISETLVSYRRESIETQLDMTILADAVPQLLH